MTDFLRIFGFGSEPSVFQTAEEQRRAAQYQAAMWQGAGEVTGLKSPPETPDVFHNRAADNWRPLLAIADRIGGAWPARARSAAIKLSGSVDDDDQSVGELLLGDIKAIFDEIETDKIASSQLVERLIDMEDRPWPEWRQGKPVTARQIAARLKPFRITPRTIREVGKKPAKGYRRKDFEDAFARYLPQTDPSHRHNPQKTVENDQFRSVTAVSGVTDETTQKPPKTGTCDGVTDENPHDGSDGRVSDEWGLEL